MKKTLTMFICMVLLLTACGSKSAIQVATGADNKQSTVIIEIMESVGIDYETLAEVKNNKPDIDLEAGWKVYEVIDRGGASYFLVLDAEFNVVTIYDSELNMLITGLST